MDNREGEKKNRGEKTTKKCVYICKRNAKKPLRYKSLSNWMVTGIDVVLNGDTEAATKNVELRVARNLRKKSHSRSVRNRCSFFFFFFSLLHFSFPCSSKY